MVVVEPDGERDGRGEGKVAGDAEEGEGGAVVVDEGAEGGGEEGEVPEKGEEVVSDDPFLVGIGIGEVEITSVVGV